MASIVEIFRSYEADLQSETAVKEQIRKNVQSLEATAREMESILQQIHRIPESAYGPMLDSAKSQFVAVQANFASLQSCFPAAEYYRYNFLWKHVLQQLTGLVVLMHFLEFKSIVSLASVRASLVGASSFEIDVEDFLFALCNTTQELARLAANSVTLGDMHMPAHIVVFIRDVNNGFRTLSLKNDGLRKRYDGVKYDLKRAEGVVYDVSIRGLTPATH